MFFRFRFITYLVLALLKVALVNFTLNEYMMMMPVSQRAPQAYQVVDHHRQPVGKISAVLACQNLKFTTHILR